MNAFSAVCRFLVGAMLVLGMLVVGGLGLARDLPGQVALEGEGAWVLLVGKAGRAAGLDEPAVAHAAASYACEGRQGSVLVRSDRGPPPSGALVVLVGRVSAGNDGPAAEGSPRGGTPAVREMARLSLP